MFSIFNRFQVFRLCASFLSDSKAESLMAASRLGAESCPESVPRNPWFGEEVLLRPRAGLVPSAGYVFVSADYSQVIATSFARFGRFSLCLNVHFFTAVFAGTVNAQGHKEPATMGMKSL